MVLLFHDGSDRDMGDICILPAIVPVQVSHPLSFDYRHDFLQRIDRPKHTGTSQSIQRDRVKTLEAFITPPVYVINPIYD